MIEIVTAQERHIDDIMALERECIVPPWSEGSLLGEMERPDAFFALAVDDGRILGFCLLHRCADEAELYQIAVTAGDRRRGVAGMLLDAGLSWCRENSLVAVWLEVRKSNEAALSLYQKYGFTVEGRRKKYYVNPVEDAVLMALRL
jgi:ribosomal-protein-alanine N-acetyltransferase